MWRRSRQRQRSLAVFLVADISAATMAGASDASAGVTCRVRNCCVIKSCESSTDLDRKQGTLVRLGKGVEGGGNEYACRALQHSQAANNAHQTHHALRYTTTTSTLSKSKRMKTRRARCSTTTRTRNASTQAALLLPTFLELSTSNPSEGRAIVLSWSSCYHRRTKPDQLAPTLVKETVNYRETRNRTATCCHPRAQKPADTHTIRIPPCGPTSSSMARQARSHAPGS